MTETVKDVFEELLRKWRKERRVAVIERYAGSTFASCQLDRIEDDCDEYRRRFEAALGERQAG